MRGDMMAISPIYKKQKGINSLVSSKNRNAGIGSCFIEI